MAIKCEIKTQNGMANYHRLTSVRMDYSPDPNVPGSIGCAYVDVLSYADERSRASGEAPKKVTLVQIRFGENVSSQLSPKGWPSEAVPITEKIFDSSTGEWKIVKVGEKSPPAPIEIAVVRKNEPSREDIYNAIKEMPEYSDSEDA